MFKVNMAGYMVEEFNFTKIYRPHGSGDWLFLYFPQPMIFFNEDGSTEITKKDACVIFGPEDYHSFGGYPNFQNTYVHFTCSEEEMSRFSIERGKIFYSANAGRMNRIVSTIKDEVIENAAFSDEMLSAYVMQLMITAERSFYENTDDMKESFAKLRYDMLLNYEKKYSAEKLAASVCMSKSRFYEKYKMYFGQSPKQELIKIRMETARVLLTNEKLSVSEVSQRVGFESPEHFSRYFRKYFGTPPKNRTKHQV